MGRVPRAFGVSHVVLVSGCVCVLGWMMWHAFPRMFVLWACSILRFRSRPRLALIVWIALVMSLMLWLSSLCILESCGVGRAG